ncbi:MAG: CPBP family intramembrane metalloprotease [Archangium sp.]
MKKIFRADDGRVRSGWVIVVFGIAASLVGGGVIVILTLLGLGEPNTIEPRLLFPTLASLSSGVAATLVVAFLFKEETVFDTKPLKPFGIGFALGAAAIVLSVIVPVLAGAQTLKLNPQFSPMRMLLEFIALAPAGFGEELLLRGLAFQALRRGVGTPAAVIGSSVLFGVMHLTNPHASIVAALIITLVGLWFGTALVRTGTIWLPMGLHVGWNFFEGSVFGQPVSGLSPGVPLFTATWPASRSFLSGSDFGPEAAGWTAVVLALALALTLWTRRNLSTGSPS